MFNTYLSIIISIHLSLHLSILLSMNLSILLFLHLSILLSNNLSTYSSIYPSIYSTIHISVYITEDKIRHTFNLEIYTTSRQDYLYYLLIIISIYLSRWMQISCLICWLSLNTLTLRSTLLADKTIYIIYL